MAHNQLAVSNRTARAAPTKRILALAALLAWGALPPPALAGGGQGGDGWSIPWQPLPPMGPAGSGAGKAEQLPPMRPTAPFIPIEPGVQEPVAAPPTAPKTAASQATPSASPANPWAGIVKEALAPPKGNAPNPAAGPTPPTPPAWPPQGGPGGNYPGGNYPGGPSGNYPGGPYPGGPGSYYPGGPGGPSTWQPGPSVPAAGLAAPPAPVAPAAAPAKPAKSLSSVLEKTISNPLRRWAVQVGAFAKIEEALGKVESLKQTGHRARMVAERKGEVLLYKVRLGHFRDEASAIAAAEEWRRESGSEGIVVKE